MQLLKAGSSIFVRIEYYELNDYIRFVAYFDHIILHGATNLCVC